MKIGKHIRLVTTLLTRSIFRGLILVQLMEIHTCQNQISYCMYDFS